MHLPLDHGLNNKLGAFPAAVHDMADLFVAAIDQWLAAPLQYLVARFQALFVRRPTRLGPADVRVEHAVLVVQPSADHCQAKATRAIGVILFVSVQDDPFVVRHDRRRSSQLVAHSLLVRGLPLRRNLHLKKSKCTWKADKWHSLH